MPNYTYGSFVLNANANGYFLVAKDMDYPTYRPTLSPVARADMYKVNGWQISERQIQVDITVVGNSRPDMEARKDALEAALALRDQQLVLNSDGRYWIANAQAGQTKFMAGYVTSCKIPVKFLCANPFPVSATASTFDTGNQTYGLVTGSTYLSSTFSFVGGGSAYAFPQIHLVHQTANPGTTTLTAGLTLNTVYTSLTVASSPALSAGQVLSLYWNTGSPNFILNTQKVTVASTVTGGATTIPVNSFTANASYPTTTTSVSISTAWNTVTVTQTTDNMAISATSTANLPLPQLIGDYLDIYCDPGGTSGWQILTNGLPGLIDPVGTFPVQEVGSTSWTVQITADAQPTVDALWTWYPRYQS